jgi:hypothetical protein
MPGAIFRRGMDASFAFIGNWQLVMGGSDAR